MTASVLIEEPVPTRSARDFVAGEARRPGFAIPMRLR